MIQVNPSVTTNVIEVQLNSSGSDSENSFTVEYLNSRVSRIVYETGKVKNFSYSNDLLSSVSTIYEGSIMLKTFIYDSNGTLTGAEVTYS